MSTPRSSSSTDPVRLEVGHVSRPHGVHGDVLVAPLTNVADRRFVVGARLWVGGAQLEITEARPHGTRWIIHFAGVDGRDGAVALRGAVVEGEPLDDDSIVWVHELVGCEVATVDGRQLGEVVAVEANPASDLLVLDSGVLVPMTFVTEMGDRSLTVDPPAGLVDE
jgi:16S rRNA processing protein RimM